MKPMEKTFQNSSTEKFSKEMEHMQVNKLEVGYSVPKDAQ